MQLAWSRYEQAWRISSMNDVARLLDLAASTSHDACQTPDGVNEPSFQFIAIVGMRRRRAAEVIPARRFALGGRGVGGLLHPLPSFADAAHCRLPRRVDDMGNSPEDLRRPSWAFAMQLDNRGCLCPFTGRLRRAPLAVRASIDVVGEFTAAGGRSGRSAQSVRTRADSAADGGCRSEGRRQSGNATDGFAEQGKGSEFHAAGRPRQQSLVALA